MELEILFNKVFKFWPKEIDISDGKILEEDGFLSCSLIDVYDAIEETVGGDDWIDVGCWAFSQTIHEYAKYCFNNGIKIIYPDDISIDEFKKNLLMNLDDESWESERKEFHQIN